MDLELTLHGIDWQTNRFIPLLSWGNRKNSKRSMQMSADTIGVETFSFLFRTSVRVINEEDAALLFSHSLHPDYNCPYPVVCSVTLQRSVHRIWSRSNMQHVEQPDHSLWHSASLPASKFVAFKFVISIVLVWNPRYVFFVRQGDLDTYSLHFAHYWNLVSSGTGWSCPCFRLLLRETEREG